MNQRCLDLLEKAKNNPKNLRFNELKKLCLCAGMTHDRTNGSHHIYKKTNPFKLVSIQEMKDGKAKEYQVKQILDFIEENN